MSSEAAGANLSHRAKCVRHQLESPLVAATSEETCTVNSGGFDEQRRLLFLNLPNFNSTDCTVLSALKRGQMR